MSKKSNRRYNINQCSLYMCKSKNRIIELLNLTESEFNDINKIIRYDFFEINKPNSAEKRKITSPHKRLKEIQSRILKLLSFVERPSWLFSAEKGKSYIDNAKQHQNSDFHLTVDIKKFYDNCTREYVYSFFCYELLMSKDIAKLLTDITTYENKIPTGCPTSQIIAYYAYQKMFNELSTLSLKNNCVFSLYVDDITFSSSSDFNYKKLSSEIDIILRKYGHKIKGCKTTYYKKNKSAVITGVVITPNHELMATNKLKHSVIKELKNINKGKKVKKESLIGKIASVQRIETTKFTTLPKLVEQIVE